MADPVEWWLIKLRDLALRSLLVLGRNRIPLGEVDVADHPEAPWSRQGGGPEDQPAS